MFKFQVYRLPIYNTSQCNKKSLFAKINKYEQNRLKRFQQNIKYFQSQGKLELKYFQESFCNNIENYNDIEPLDMDDLIVENDAFFEESD